MEPARSHYPSPEARVRFGHTLTAWARRNGWVHDTLHIWGEQAGFPGIRDSVFNKLQNGKTEQPTPLCFIQLAMANERVARADYSGVVDRKLKDRLLGSEPICKPDGTLWRAADFFDHFVGELDAPDWALAPQLLSAEEAASLSAEQQSTFVAIAKDKGLTPALAWKELERHCAGMTPSQRDVLRNVLSGWHEWTPQEWETLAANGSDPVADALAAWENS